MPSSQSATCPVEMLAVTVILLILMELVLR